MAEKSSNGLKTAVDLVMAAMPGEDLAEPEQIDLEDYLGLPPRGDLGTGGAVAGGARGPGRPPGARNKRTTQWAEYLLSRYASPLEVLAQIAVARVEDLKAQLACTALEAFQEKRHAAVALAPFLHQRQPLALNLTERKVVYLTIQQDSGAGSAVPNDAMTLSAQIVGNQEVIDVSPGHVERGHVERDAQPIDRNGQSDSVTRIGNPLHGTPSGPERATPGASGVHEGGPDARKE